jgi:hypothetical protein
MTWFEQLLCKLFRWLYKCAYNNPDTRDNLPMKDVTKEDL